MKVTVVRGGGVAGVVVTTTVDTSDLDDDDAAALREVRAAASFSDRPPSGRPDATRVAIDVDDDGALDRVRYDDGDAPEGAADLAHWVQTCSRARRTVGR